MKRGLEVERTNCTRCHKPFKEVGRATNLRTGEPAALCLICHKNMAKYRKDQEARSKGMSTDGNNIKWHNLWPPALL